MAAIRKLARARRATRSVTASQDSTAHAIEESLAIASADERPFEDGPDGSRLRGIGPYYPRVVTGVPERATVLSTVWEEPRAGSAII
jgi:uncharacterized protein (DUF2342 family)